MKVIEDEFFEEEKGEASYEEGIGIVAMQTLLGLAEVAWQGVKVLYRISVDIGHIEGHLKALSRAKR